MLFSLATIAFDRESAQMLSNTIIAREKRTFKPLSSLLSAFSNLKVFPIKIISHRKLAKFSLHIWPIRVWEKPSFRYVPGAFFFRKSRPEIPEKSKRRKTKRGSQSVSAPRTEKAEKIEKGQNRVNSKFFHDAAQDSTLHSSKLASKLIAQSHQPCSVSFFLLLPCTHVTGLGSKSEKRKKEPEYSKFFQFLARFSSFLSRRTKRGIHKRGIHEKANFPLFQGKLYSSL